MMSADSIPVVIWKCSQMIRTSQRAKVDEKAQRILIQNTYRWAMISNVKTFEYILWNASPIGWKIKTILDLMHFLCMLWICLHSFVTSRAVANDDGETIHKKLSGGCSLTKSFHFVGVLVHSPGKNNSVSLQLILNFWLEGSLSLLCGLVANTICVHLVLGLEDWGALLWFPVKHKLGFERTVPVHCSDMIYFLPAKMPFLWLAVKNVIQSERW